MPETTPIHCPVPPLHDFEPCDPAEVAPLVAHLLTDRPVEAPMTFPRGTVLSDGRLDLCKQSLGRDGCRRVTEALTHNTTIKSLLLGTDGIGDAGAKDVAALLARNGALEIVYLGCNRIGAAGVGRLTIVDDDAVDLSNLQRQTIYATDDIGRPKALVAAKAARRLNPHVDAVAEARRIDTGNVAGLLSGADAVLDGCDNFATRLLVADSAFAARVPLVSAAIGQFDGQLGVFRGWEADMPCYRCFVGDDPDRPEASCADQGVLGALTGVVGSLAALEAIRAIVPFGEDSAGKLLLIDALGLRMRTIALPADPGCRWCGSAREG